jgi:hypothetical protein
MCSGSRVDSVIKLKLTGGGALAKRRWKGLEKREGVRWGRG